MTRQTVTNGFVEVRDFNSDNAAPSTVVVSESWTNTGLLSDS